MAGNPLSKLQLVWLVVGILVVELIGVGGLIVSLGGGGSYALAQMAVCAALVIVPVLFGIALRSELRSRNKQ